MAATDYSPVNLTTGSLLRTEPPEDKRRTEDKKDPGGRDMFGWLDGFFDFNHDGKLDSFEKAAEFATFMSILDEEEEQKRRESDFGFDEDDDD